MTPSNPPGPEQPARPAPASAEEAVEIARTQYSPVWPDGTPAPLKVSEFDIGYVVYAELPPHPATTPSGKRNRPRSPGGSCVVVTKDTGEVCRVPQRPLPDSIALFRKFYRPDTL